MAKRMYKGFELTAQYEPSIAMTVLTAFRPADGWVLTDITSGKETKATFYHILEIMVDDALEEEKAEDDDD
jgi:hypothetical protein